MAIIKPKKATAGRPPMKPADRHTSVNTTISPETRAYLDRIGDGSTSRGARRVLAAAAKENREISVE